MTDATILLLFPGIFALAIGVVIFATTGPGGGKPYFLGHKSSPLDFKTLFLFGYIAAIIAHFIIG